MHEINTEEKNKRQNNADKPRANRRSDRKDKGHHEIKIVVRHLPPTMTEKEFLEQVDPLPESDSNSYYYCPADWSLGQEATCRAYIDMSNIAEVVQFRDRFDGYVFVDSKGAEYVAIVEYAPFQCFVKNKARNNDNKVNTIESESHYQEFMQKLEEEREEASRMGDVKIDFTFDRKTEEKVKSTPLLQYLANKKEKRREEARKRNEEKRKQREEQKQLRLLDAITASENTKSKDTSTDTNKKPANSNSKKDAQQQEPVKASRSKRRTERDQRRREEHEQRKLMREREQREKKKTDKDKDKPSTASTSKAAKQTKNSKEEVKSEKDIVILKKTVNSEDVKSSAELEAKSAEGNVSDNVKKFIQTAGSLKGNDYADNAVEERLSGHNTESAKAAYLRSSEERRIRNKDRPSIAIYQPKARMRSGDGSQNATKSTEGLASEGEASLPEEKPNKRNKRSGRRNKRSGRANIPKSSPSPSEFKENPDLIWRVSKSSESSNHSANSSTTNHRK